jgi:hypothetical protein
MNLKQYYSEKLRKKIDNYSNKNYQLKKYYFPFFKFPIKLKSRHNMQLNTLTRREYKGNIYVKDIRKKIMHDPNTDPESKPTEK